MKTMNPQEALWAGRFGEEYQQRSPGNVEANRVLFEHVLRRLKIQSVIEFGAGVGNNLKALAQLLPKAWLQGVEINDRAYRALRAEFPASVKGSLLDWQVVDPADLAFTKGLLIHIAPEDLPIAYDALHAAGKRYVMIAEYYNPTPVAIPYRGQPDALWKRDFAGELLDRFKDLRLIDYGWVYHRDAYPQDDLTWFLMEKR